MQRALAGLLFALALPAAAQVPAAPQASAPAAMASAPPPTPAQAALPRLQLLGERLEARVQRRDVEFVSEGQRLRGWLFTPKGRAAGAAPLPAIVMLVGFSGVKEQTYAWFAAAWAAQGHAVLVYDPPHFGASEGQPRHEMDPWRQVRAARDALDWLQRQPGIDGKRLGVWGGSLGGGHAIVLAAIDRRVRAVVALTPPAGTLGQVNSPQLEVYQRLQPLFAADRAARARGDAPLTIPVVGGAPGELVAIPGERAAAFRADIAALSASHGPRVTLRSLEALLQYEPLAYLHRVSPTPLLLLQAQDDGLVDNAAVRVLFELAAAPKQLRQLPGHHFSPYLEGFDEAAVSALEWFSRHL